MEVNIIKCYAFASLWLISCALSQAAERSELDSASGPQTAGQVARIHISGELKQWHKISVTLRGPHAHERDEAINPFTDYEFKVTFTHESGMPSYVVPGYFAADGDAANSGAESGDRWRVHLSPDKTGEWSYHIQFRTGKHAALGGASAPLAPFDGISGKFIIASTDKSLPDFRAAGRLVYEGRHHLRFAGSGEYFLKAGPDSPETLLAYADIDGTIKGKSPLKTWSPHARDWRTGDPTWGGGRGKNLIGAINYLSNKGLNTLSFLTYNAGGDGDNVWPFVARDQKLRYDCSKLDQWGVLFDHATNSGIHLHFKLQENESDDERIGKKRKAGRVPEALDGGKLGPERMLYCREIIARFGHALALNWNIGEENTQTTEEVQAMADQLRKLDPYKHPIVLHTFPDEQELVYSPLLGNRSALSGLSLQNSWKIAHQQTLRWIRRSTKAGHPWVVAHDEQNPAGLGVPPDIGYKGSNGIALETKLKGSKSEGYVTSEPYTMHDIRKLCLWGNLMAGGAGVEYYFGYKLAENDLICQDFRSREKSWDYCRIALNIFRKEKIPFAEMANANSLVGNYKDDNSLFCLALSGDVYLVYFPKGGSAELDLSGTKGDFRVKWINPRENGVMHDAPGSFQGGIKLRLKAPDAEDWLALVRR